MLSNSSRMSLPWKKGCFKSLQWNLPRSRSKGESQEDGFILEATIGYASPNAYEFNSVGIRSESPICSPHPHVNQNTPARGSLISPTKALHTTQNAQARASLISPTKPSQRPLPNVYVDSARDYTIQDDDLKYSSTGSSNRFTQPGSHSSRRSHQGHNPSPLLLEATKHSSAPPSPEIKENFNPNTSLSLSPPSPIFGRSPRKFPHSQAHTQSHSQSQTQPHELPTALPARPQPSPLRQHHNPAPSRPQDQSSPVVVSPPPRAHRPAPPLQQHQPLEEWRKKSTDSFSGLQEERGRADARGQYSPASKEGQGGLQQAEALIGHPLLKQTGKTNAKNSASGRSVEGDNASPPVSFSSIEGLQIESSPQHGTHRFPSQAASLSCITATPSSLSQFTPACKTPPTKTGPLANALLGRQTPPANKTPSVNNTPTGPLANALLGGIKAASPLLSPSANSRPTNPGLAGLAAPPQTFSPAPASKSYTQSTPGPLVPNQTPVTPKVIAMPKQLTRTASDSPAKLPPSPRVLKARAIGEGWLMKTGAFVGDMEKLVVQQSLSDTVSDNRTRPDSAREYWTHNSGPGNNRCISPADAAARMGPNNHFGPGNRCISPNDAAAARTGPMSAREGRTMGTRSPSPAERESSLWGSSPAAQHSSRQPQHTGPQGMNIRSSYGSLPGNSSPSMHMQSATVQAPRMSPSPQRHPSSAHAPMMQWSVSQPKLPVSSRPETIALTVAAPVVPIHRPERTPRHHDRVSGNERETPRVVDRFTSNALSTVRGERIGEGRNARNDHVTDVDAGARMMEMKAIQQAQSRMTLERHTQNGSVWEMKAPQHTHNGSVYSHQYASSPSQLASGMPNGSGKLSWGDVDGNNATVQQTRDTYTQRRDEPRQVAIRPCDAPAQSRNPGTQLRDLRDFYHQNHNHTGSSHMQTRDPPMQQSHNHMQQPRDLQWQSCYILTQQSRDLPRPQSRELPIHHSHDHPQQQSRDHQMQHSGVLPIHEHPQQQSSDFNMQPRDFPTQQSRNMPVQHPYDMPSRDASRQQISIPSSVQHPPQRGPPDQWHVHEPSAAHHQRDADRRPVNTHVQKEVTPASTQGARDHANARPHIERSPAHKTVHHNSPLMQAQPRPDMQTQHVTKPDAGGWVVLQADDQESKSSTATPSRPTAQSGVPKSPFVELAMKAGPKPDFSGGKDLVSVVTDWMSAVQRAGSGKTFFPSNSNASKPAANTSNPASSNGERNTPRSLMMQIEDDLNMLGDGEPLWGITLQSQEAPFSVKSKVSVNNRPRTPQGISHM